MSFVYISSYYEVVTTLQNIFIHIFKNEDLAETQQSVTQDTVYYLREIAVKKEKDKSKLNYNP